MNFRNITVVYLKELKDALRDRRTLLSMIVVPTLLMPVLMFTIGLISVKVIKKARAEVPSVMIIGGDDSPQVVSALHAHEKIKVIPAAPDWKQRISDKKVRAVVELPAGFQQAMEQGREATVTLYHYEGEMKSGFAQGELRRFFNDLRDQTVASRLSARSLPATLIKPFELKSQNVAPPEKVGGNIIGGIIPYFFILLAFTGAMYPAMDLTAGEKERGTLETILCSPIGRIDLVLGKFLMVLTASLATVVFSLTSMTLSFLVGGALLAGGALQSGATKAAQGAAASGVTLPSLDPAGLLAVVVMVVPVAVFFAAVLLTVSLFAKSYKEAQTYVSPLIIVVIMPAVMGMLPGVELNTRLALVPILNLALVSKEMVSGVFNFPYIALIFGSSCVYAAAALALCVRIFNRESVIFRT